MTAYTPAAKMPPLNLPCVPHEVRQRSARAKPQDRRVPELRWQECLRTLESISALLQRTLQEY